MLRVDQNCKAFWVQLTAPVVSIMTADYKKVHREKRSGTSFGKSIILRPHKILLLKPHVAAPQVAGLATVIAAEGDYGSAQGSWEAGVMKLRQEIISLAYSRSPVTPISLANYPLGIWNGVGVVNGQCGTRVPPTRRRDAIPDEAQHPPRPLPLRPRWPLSQPLDPVGRPSPTPP